MRDPQGCYRLAAFTLLARWFLFAAAVGVLYGSGFLYHQVGPVLYGLISVAFVSLPLVLKLGFWQKAILLLPLLLLRIVGKYILLFFGRNALTALMRKYGLIEKKWNALLNTFEQSKTDLVDLWQRLPRHIQAYLIVIFLPIALTICIGVVLVKIVRLKMVQFVLENSLTRLFGWIAKRFKRG